MSETKRIAVAEASEGFGCADEPGTEISLPVVELLTGRGFVTGKSGSGKSNSASVIAEKLLDNGFGLLIVDIDGEYYGLKEEYEILHAGGDDECDIQVTAEHSEKLASLALEQNVPIILDVSSYLDEDEAKEILTAVSRSLFAKAKKQKQPFLLLVEEVHEYIPENGSVGECGRMLIKIGKRGRKHGLGICGISQRPADVKKDFITQCDWLLWHRLTWNNDTKVVGRILDNDYADAVEDLGDGEGFLMTDWTEMVQRVQFYRKQTFDAGATPGLDDFERPELKSVSDDLMSELQDISDEQQRTADRIAELREELDKKNSRIAELERELQDARDLSRMAEQFVEAMVDEVNGPQIGTPERERMRQSHIVTNTDSTKESHSSRQANGATSGDAAENTAATQRGHPGAAYSEAMADTEAQNEDQTAQPEQQAQSSTDSTDDQAPAFADLAGVGSDSTENDAGMTDTKTSTAVDGQRESDMATTDGGGYIANGAESDASEFASEFSADAIRDALKSARTLSVADVRTESDDDLSIREQIEASKAGDSRFVSTSEDSDAEVEAEPAASDAGTGSTDDDAESTDKELSASDIIPDLGVGESNESETETDPAATRDPDHTFDLADPTVSNSSEEPATVSSLKTTIANFPRQTRKMLAVYREEGPETALNVHFSAGGDGSRTEAYAQNRQLRTRGLIDHVGRGKYDYRLRALLATELPVTFDEEQIDEYATRIEESVLSE